MAKAAGLGFSEQGTVNFALKLTDFGEPEVAVLELDAVPPLLEADGVVLPFPFEPRIAWRLSRLDPAEESAEREVYTVSDVLQKVSVNLGEFRVVFLPVREGGFLFVSADRFPCCVVLKSAPVNETVIDQAAGFQGCVKLTRLRFRGADSRFVYPVDAHGVIVHKLCQVFFFSQYLFSRDVAKLTSFGLPQ